MVDNYHRPVDLNNVPFHILFQIDIIENDDRPMGRRPVEQEQMHENDMTRLQQIAMNPKIIDVPTPMSMNDFIEYRNIKKMIYDNKIQYLKDKLKKKMKNKNI